MSEPLDAASFVAAGPDQIDVTPEIDELAFAGLEAIGRERIDVLLELDPARRADWPEEIARFFRV